MVRHKTAPTYNEQLQAIVTKFIESGQKLPVTTHAIAAFAVREGLWKPQPSTIIDQCAEHLARAMREEYIKDEQGRTVRAKHVARVVRDGIQTALWDDIRTAPREHMAIAFQQRRQQIVGDCRQLKTDVDSYNENKIPQAPIQMVFDFTEDLLEIEAMVA